jgi:hypothetical protein
MHEGFAVSIRGYSHIKENIARQDCAAVYTDPAGWTLAAVSDGHGGDEYFRSHIGARLAVECAVLSVINCLEEKDVFLEALRGARADSDKIFARLAGNIINNWNTLTKKFHSDPEGFDWDALVTQPVGCEDKEGINPGWEQAWMEERGVGVDECRVERLYGCTLIAAVMSPEFCFAVQIGDGCCAAVYPDGGASMMIPDNDGLPPHVTHSLCEYNALEWFKHRFVVAGEEGVPLPAGIVLSTDGLYNSFDDPEIFLRFNRRVLSRMDKNVRGEFVVELEEHLNERSRLGSSDDISIALVYDPEMDFEAVGP